MDDELSCDINKYQEQLRSKKRIAVTFVGKEMGATESYLEALGAAYEDGFFGDMEMGVIPVDNEECDRLAEQEGADVIPKTCVYSHGKQVGCVTPTDEDARTGYRKTIEQLIDLSE